MTTPNLQLDELDASQSQPHVKVNRDLRKLDAAVQLRVLDKDLTAPPGSPGDGDAYIPAATSTGAWVGLEGTVQFYSGGWQTLYPKSGWRAYMVDEDAYYRYSAGSPEVWAVDAGGGGGGSVTVRGTGSPGETVEDVTEIRVSGLAEVSQVSAGVAQIEVLGDGGGNGGGGSSTLTVNSSGSPGQSVPNVTSLLFSDLEVADGGGGVAVISGSSSGGSGEVDASIFWTSSFDDAPVSPTIYDDEFDDEVFDAGSPSKWMWANQGSATATESAATLGHVLLSTPNSASDSYRCIASANALPSGAWKFRCKMFAQFTPQNYAHAGMYVRNLANGRLYSLGPYYNGGELMVVTTMNTVTSFNGTQYTLSKTHSSYYYLEIEYNLTNLIFRYYPVTAPWNPITVQSPVAVVAVTVAPSSFLLAVPTEIGLFVDSHSSNTGPSLAYFDWFRRIS